jgi:hypothetical protein
MKSLLEVINEAYKPTREDLESFVNDYCRYFGITNIDKNVTYGKKYIKISNGRSVKVFVDYEGNIYKPASHASPAKGIRGTIYDEFTEVFDQLGNPHYLK